MSDFTCPPMKIRKSSEYMAPLCTQYKHLWRRTLTMTKREPSILFARIGQAIFNGLLVLALFWKIGSPLNETNIMNQTGCMYFTLVSVFMGEFFPTLSVFQKERAVFLRESANQMYGLFPYYLTKNAVEIPISLLCPGLLLFIMYFGVGFHNSWIEFA